MRQMKYEIRCVTCDNFHFPLPAQLLIICDRRNHRGIYVRVLVTPKKHYLELA